jgi:hypothetical protein
MFAIEQRSTPGVIGFCGIVHLAVYHPPRGACRSAQTLGMAESMQANDQAEVFEWVCQFGIPNLPDNWVIGITLSSVPIENWFYRRNKLKPESLRLNVNVPAYGHWCVQLERHDGLFQVQWRAQDDLRIESQQLKYQKLMAWPRLIGLQAFPHLIAGVENCLGVEFMRHADVGARLLEPEKLLANEPLRNWLSPCADSFGCFMQQCGDE